MENEEFKKMKKKKIEQAQLTYRFVLEQMLMLMIYARVQILESERNKKVFRFISILLNKEEIPRDSNFTPIFKKVIHKLNKGDSVLEVMEYLESKLSTEQAKAIKGQMSSYDAYFGSDSDRKGTKYCLFLQYLFMGNQYSIIKNVLALNDTYFFKNKLNENLDYLLEYHSLQIDSYSGLSGKELTNDDIINDIVAPEFDNQVIDCISNTIEGSINKLGCFHKTSEVSIKDFYKTFLKKGRVKEKYIKYDDENEGSIKDNNIISVISINENVQENAKIFGCQKSFLNLLGAKIYSDFTTTEKQTLKKIEDLYFYCRGSLFLKINQVPKIIANIIEFDLRYVNSAINLDSDHVDIEITEHWYGKSKNTQIKEEHSALYYMEETTKKIGEVFKDCKIMDSWKDTKSMTHRFRSQSKVLHEYKIYQEKSIDRIIEKQARKIKESNCVVPLVILNEKFLFFPLIIM